MSYISLKLLTNIYKSIIFIKKKKKINMLGLNLNVNKCKLKAKD